MYKKVLAGVDGRAHWLPVAPHTPPITAACVIEGDTNSGRLHVALKVHCCVTARRAGGMWAGTQEQFQKEISESRLSRVAAAC